jgi:hypothetical protein
MNRPLNLLKRLALAGWVLGGMAGLAGAAEMSFPIGVWLQNPTNASPYRAAGVNTFVGLWQGPTAEQLEALQKAGLKVICAQNQVALQHPARTSIIAWMHNDEPDNSQQRGARLGFGGPIPPAQIQADYRTMRQHDPSRPVFLNLGQGVAWDAWYGRGQRNNRPEDYPEYLKGADIVSFDIYPANHGSPEIAGNLWYVATGVQRLRRWSEDTKPVWSCIETTHIQRSGRKPTPAEVRAEVWMALIHGARGIIYFAHQFEPTFVEAALLADAKMLAAVTKLNQQITELAPVLNAPEPSIGVTVHSTNAAVPIAYLTKQHEGCIYLFAVAMRPGTNTVKFASKDFSGTKIVAVLGENRTLAVENGTFTDSFGPWEVHLYRMASEAAR